MSEPLHGTVSDTGRQRDHNEDSYALHPEAGLYVVCDGMGGHQGGEVASALAAETILQAALDGEPLDRSVAAAHHAILDAAKHGRGARGMGATAVALKLSGADYEIAWVGDSRAYLWDGALRRLTRDHSYVQRLLDAGALTPEEADKHPEGNVVTQALGAVDLKEVQVDTITGRLCAGQQLLLCSDGLTSELADDAIAELLRQGGPPQQAAQHLVDAANANGGGDNITVLLIPAPADAPPKPARGGTRPMSTHQLNQHIAQSKSPSNKTKLLAASIGALLLLVLATGYWWWSRPTAPPPPAATPGAAPLPPARSTAPPPLGPLDRHAPTAPTDPMPADHPEPEQQTETPIIESPPSEVADPGVYDTKDPETAAPNPFMETAPDQTGPPGQTTPADAGAR